MDYRDDFDGDFDLRYLSNYHDQTSNAFFSAFGSRVPQSQVMANENMDRRFTVCCRIRQWLLLAGQSNHLWSCASDRRRHRWDRMLGRWAKYRFYSQADQDHRLSCLAQRRT